MNIGFFAFGQIHWQAVFATHPLARLIACLPLSLVVADAGLPPPRVAASKRSDAPSDASDYGF